METTTIDSAFVSPAATIGWRKASGTRTDSVREYVTSQLEGTDYSVAAVLPVYLDVLDFYLPGGLKLVGNNFYVPFGDDERIAKFDILHAVRSISVIQTAQTHVKD